MSNQPTICQPLRQRSSAATSRIHRCRTVTREGADLIPMPKFPLKPFIGRLERACFAGTAPFHEKQRDFHHGDLSTQLAGVFSVSRRC